MTITLPDEMRDELERKAKAAGFVTVDEYIQYLVVEDLSLDTEVVDDPVSSLTPKNRAELETMLEAGMKSGGEVEADDAFWAERQRVLLEKIARKTGTTP